MFAHPADVVGFDTNRAKKGLAALAIVVAGVGLGFVVAERGDTDFLTVDAMTMRGSEMANHLDELVATGQAQLAAMREAELIRQRINTGLVQQAAIDAAAANRK